MAVTELLCTSLPSFLPRRMSTSKQSDRDVRSITNTVIPPIALGHQYLHRTPGRDSPPRSAIRHHVSPVTNCAGPTHTHRVRVPMPPPHSPASPATYPLTAVQCLPTSDQTPSGHSAQLAQELGIPRQTRGRLMFDKRSWV